MKRSRIIAVCLGLAVAGTSQVVAAWANPANPAVVPHAMPRHLISERGNIVQLGATSAIMRLRTGKMLTVDLTEALTNGIAVALYPGRRILVRGTRNPDATFHAVMVWRLNNRTPFWPPDDQEN